MSGKFEWPTPGWMADIPPAERDACLLRFNLALASLYANPSGSPLRFAEQLGLGPNAISVAKSRGRIAPETALKIEHALGRELFPWQMFLPALVLDLTE